MARRLLRFHRIRYGPYGNAHLHRLALSRNVRARRISSDGLRLAAVGQAYNSTGAYAATHQTSNAYGSSEARSTPEAAAPAYTQHATNANETVATGHSAGRKPAAAASASISATAEAWLQPQMATNTPQQMATSTRTPAVAGTRPEPLPHNTSSYSGANSACCERLWRAAKEHRRLWRRQQQRRLAVPAGERSRFHQPRWWRRMGRSQMNQTATA